MIGRARPTRPLFRDPIERVKRCQKKSDPISLLFFPYAPTEE
jgi:hypothetical protein